MTDRLPFDPGKVPARDLGGPARRERKRKKESNGVEALNVTQVTELIKRAMAEHTPSPLWVVGEVSNFNDRGHWYLSLKDADNVLSCVMWASAASRCGFTPQRGQQVLAKGRLDYYGPQGKLQMYIDALRPAGQGALELRFRQLCEELRALGYFDESRKKALPLFARRIAVVTSESGAALQDVIRTAKGRWAGCRLCLFDVRVQGEGAAAEIAAAIRAIDAGHERLTIDAVIVTRGGGSLEDLWAFNERVVADAIFKAKVPIVAAIGHETDTTIAELVADRRCSTPTQAAMLLTPDAKEQHHRLSQLGDRVRLTVRRRVERARSQLIAAARHPLFHQPRRVVETHRREVAGLAVRLGASLRHRLHEARRALASHEQRMTRLEPTHALRLGRQRIGAAEQRLRRSVSQRVASGRQCIASLMRELQAIGPRNVLERGYTFTTTGEGLVIRSAQQAMPGQLIVTHLIDGRIHSQVIREGTGGGAARKGKPRGVQGESGLFESES